MVVPLQGIVLPTLSIKKQVLMSKVLCTNNASNINLITFNIETKIDYNISITQLSLTEWIIRVGG